MTGHDWWHNASLRTSAAVGEGWRLFQEIYLPTQYDSGALERIRRTRLVESLERAARTEHFEAHLKDRAVTPENAEDVLASLPVLDKGVLRHTPEAITTGLVKDWDELIVHTSGTTGEPVWITHDETKLTEATASNLRMLEAYGLQPGLRVIRATADLRHAPFEFETLPYFGGAKVLQINVSTLTARDADYVERLCADFKPDILWGQPLEVLLAALRGREGTLRIPQLKAVLTHGDSLDANARDTIFQAFGCPHYDLYGLQEFGRVGWECPQGPGTYHIDEERVAVSVGEDGQILLSSLTNTAMSLLNYRPGDGGQLLREPCPCGRPHVRLTRIDGRKRALIADAEGQLVNIKPLRLILENEPLHRWQVRQEETGKLEVLIVPLAPEHAPRMTERLLAQLAGTMSLKELTVRPVELGELATASGKAPHFRLLATQHALSDAVASGTSSW
ncbi:phenylacetate--CoA ligase family protein [Streptomyces sp. NPDC012794]|uniref:phenylacetate--CoA ligase family protein n=1 Tax=Streptomyces sp. NPDC012794 TaxID=3364850 RepID=UPI0036A8E137